MLHLLLKVTRNIFVPSVQISSKLHEEKKIRKEIPLYEIAWSALWCNHVKQIIQIMLEIN